MAWSQIPKNFFTGDLGLIVTDMVELKSPSSRYQNTFCKQDLVGKIEVIKLQILPFFKVSIPYCYVFDKKSCEFYDLTMEFCEQTQNTSYLEH